MPTTTRAATIARITAKTRAAGLEPIDPYPGEASRRWWCRCARCANPRVAATWASIRKGCDPCRTCAGEKRAVVMRAYWRKHS